MKHIMSFMGVKEPQSQNPADLDQIPVQPLRNYIICLNDLCLGLHSLASYYWPIIVILVCMYVRIIP